MRSRKIIRAQRQPQLAEQFALAARLSCRSASAVLGHLMRLCVEQAVPGNDRSDTSLALGKVGVDAP